VPRNVEIKSRVADLAAVRARALRAGARPHAIEVQTDRYYTVDGAHRVKLRTIAGGRAELVDYRRSEASGVRASEYTVTPVRDEAAGLCLVPKGRPLVIVRKRREVLLWDNVRIHLDEVDDLGSFVELEAVVDELHDEATCHAQVATLMHALGLDEAELIRASYAEILYTDSAESV
jgi:predicted adenylyl cyclase CyaB